MLRPLDRNEAETAAARAAASFGRTLDDALVDRHRASIDDGVLWGLEHDGRVVAHCRLLPTRHWFGGRAVDSLDIGGVAVAPPERGQGFARRMMQLSVAHGAAQHFALSLLYPATTKLYRALGWDHAGEWTRYELDARAAPRGGPVLRHAGDDDWPAIQRCWERFARAQQGPAQRRRATWDALAGAAYHYVLADGDAGAGATADGSGAGEVAAYVLVDHTPIPDSWQHAIVVRDWAATTPAGLRAVVGFCGSHGTTAATVRFTAATPPQWAMLLPEQDIRRSGGMWWMARALDLEQAIAQRGFPDTLSLDVTLRVGDPLLPAWDRPLRLEVGSGKGRLVEARDADVTLEASAVGPLFTGFRSPDDLALAGVLRGPRRARDLLAAAFAGPRPCLYHIF
jgi:predicted acetyltransferase